MNLRKVFLKGWPEGLRLFQCPHSIDCIQFLLRLVKGRLNLSEPENALLPPIIQIVKLDFDMKSLIDKHRRWFIVWVSWNGTMAHLNQLNFLELCAFLGIGGNLDNVMVYCSRRRRACGRGKVFSKKFVPCSIFVRRWRCKHRAKMRLGMAMAALYYESIISMKAVIAD
jgi:hypothetical protein